MDIKDFPAFVVQRFNVRNVELLGQHLAFDGGSLSGGLSPHPGERRSEGGEHSHRSQRKPV